MPSLIFKYATLCPLMASKLTLDRTILPYAYMCNIFKENFKHFAITAQTKHITFINIHLEYEH